VLRSEAGEGFVYDARFGRIGVGGSEGEGLKFVKAGLDTGKERERKGKRRYLS
jgi:hypothetical protein